MTVTDERLYRETAILSRIGNIIMDRTALNRALSKAIAYKACGKQSQAEQWSMELIRLLDTMEILDQTKLSQFNRESL